MTFKQKNIAVSLANFVLILLVFLVRTTQLNQNDAFTPTNVFRLWGVIIVLSIFVTIAATILTHIVFAVVEAIKTGDKNPDIEDFSDERDRLIDLKGTQVTHIISSSGIALAMLSYVLGQSPLVMFSLLILFGLLAQIAGDTFRLLLYQRGF